MDLWSARVLERASSGEADAAQPTLRLREAILDESRCRRDYPRVEGSVSECQTRAWLVNSRCQSFDRLGVV